MKNCNSCKEFKELDLFKKDSRQSDGRAGTCKSCHVRSCLKYQKNSDRFKQYQKMYRSSEKEKIRKQLWKKQNSELNAIQQRKRINQINKATPKWLTENQLQEMNELYVLAKELSWLSDDILSVDHIMPIFGKETCGLHVPWNLQIIPLKENCLKGRKVG